MGENKKESVGSKAIKRGWGKGRQKGGPGERKDEEGGRYRGEEGVRKGETKEEEERAKA